MFPQVGYTYGTRIEELALKLNLTVLAVAITVVPYAAQGAVFVDNFDDEARGPQWSDVVDDASLTLSESDDRLNVRANGLSTPTSDALYLSNGPAGFRVSTTANFRIGIDYHFTAAQPVPNNFGSLAMVFGVGRDLAGRDSAAIGYAYTPVGAGAVVSHRTNNVPSFGLLDTSAPNMGRFLISYLAATDDLTFSVVDGLGATRFETMLDNVVHGQWQANDLLVSFGARGNGYSTVAGNAYLDQFAVETGTLVPEPAALATAGVVTFALLGRRRFAR